MFRSTKQIAALLLGLSAAAGVASAQFGGRPGDVVLYVVSVKGDATFRPASPTVANNPNTLTVQTPLSLPAQQFGPDFPGESRRLLHSETADNFMMIVQKEGIVSPHQMFQDPAKVLIVGGMLRLLPPNKAPIDAATGLYSPFPKSLDFGPDMPNFEELSFLWTPSPLFPVVIKVDPSYISPNNPPGLTGIDYLLTLGKFVVLTPWTGLNLTYPGQGWVQGIDRKVMEADAALGSTASLVRLRPGHTTPAFKINANTHIAVLQGSVTITPTGGGTPVTLGPLQYTFLPNGFSVVMSNPEPYSGPTQQLFPF